MKCLGERERKGHSEAAREVERHQTMSRHSVKGTGLHFRRGQRDQEEAARGFCVHVTTSRCVAFKEGPCMSLQADVLFSGKDLPVNFRHHLLPISTDRSFSASIHPKSREN